jgi:hypothetical protein
MVDVVVQVTPEVAQALREERSSPELDALRAAAREVGMALDAQHPGIQDVDLSRFLSGAAPDRVAAQEAASRLRRVAGVSSAYVVPEPDLASSQEVTDGG